MNINSLVNKKFINLGAKILSTQKCLKNICMVI